MSGGRAPGMATIRRALVTDAAPGTIGVEKEAMRARMRAARRACSASWRAWASARIAERVRATACLQEARRVALYLSLPHEVSTEGLLDHFLRAGTAVSVPVWDPAGHAYRLAEYRPDGEIVTGPHGAPEPRERRWTETGGVDVWIVPGLAFDRRGNRLGYGGGGFDRLLHRRRGIVLGVAFAFQLTASVPREPHDEPVDLVITERRTLACRVCSSSSNSAHENQPDGNDRRPRGGGPGEGRRRWTSRSHLPY